MGSPHRSARRACRSSHDTEGTSSRLASAALRWRSGDRSRGSGTGPGLRRRPSRASSLTPAAAIADSDDAQPLSAPGAGWRLRRVQDGFQTILRIKLRSKWPAF